MHVSTVKLSFLTFTQLQCCELDCDAISEHSWKLHTSQHSCLDTLCSTQLMTSTSHTQNNIEEQMYRVSMEKVCSLQTAKTAGQGSGGNLSFISSLQPEEMSCHARGNYLPTNPEPRTGMGGDRPAPVDRHPCDAIPRDLLTSSMSLADQHTFVSRTRCATT